METIHTRIKKRREELGLSMKDLALIVGVSSWQTIQQWEKENGTAPKRARLLAVAHALKVAPGYLAYGVSLPRHREEEISEILMGIEGSLSVTAEHRRRRLSSDAVLIGAAFDLLNTKEQRDAIIAQLRALDVWEWGDLPPPKKNN